MRRTLLIALLLVLTARQGWSQAAIRMTAKDTDCREWVKSSFKKNRIPPFSFLYGGRPSASFIKSWKFKQTALPAGKEGEKGISYTWTEPGSGFEVEARVKLFDNFNAAEWVLHFRNNSGENSPTIEDVKVVDLDAVSKEEGLWQLFHAEGSGASKTDFHARTKLFEPGESMVIAPYAGRSSSISFPYFNVKTPSGGIVFAIGWTGSWKAEIHRRDSGTMNISTGMRTLSAYLLPGEEIRTPMTAMLPWQGEDRMDGQNILRRFILAHHHPKANGKPVQPPICSSFNYGDPAPCNEYTCMTTQYALALLQRYERFNLLPEVFWLDAGWYEKASRWQEGYNWANTVGCWAVDRERFPGGLGEIADEVHEKGCKFMVWFEPERVMKDSYWAEQHPEFMLEANGKVPQPTWVKRGSVDSFLFNLGNDEALEWFCERIGEMIRDNRIDYYRQDFNIDPEGFWTSNDTPGRHGICEIRYIEGLYKFWDYLLKEFPGLMIDNCAGGGRRLDLEATSRSIPLWRTDYNYGEPVGYQCHTYGLSQWLPVHGTGVAKEDPFTFRSSLSATVIFNWKVTSPGFNILEMQKRRREFEEVRPYFLEDFYPLSGYGDITGDDVLLAYQLNRPSDGSGYLVAFRREKCPQASFSAHLRGLDAEAVYIVENQDTFERQEHKGTVLENGYLLSMPEARSSALIKYWKK